MSERSGATPASQRGAALVTVLLLSVAALALGLAAATSTRTELRIAHNEVLDLQALNVAEAGLNKAVKLISNHSVFNDELANNGAGACTGNGVGNAASGLASIGSAKTLASDGLCYRFAAFGGAATDGYYVRVVDNYDETVGGDDPLHDVDGTIQIIVHGVVGNAERIIAGNVSVAGWGVYGINSVQMSGGSTVTSASGQSRVGSNGNIALSSSTINGTAVAGGTVSLSGGATVSGGTTNGAPAQSFPAVTPCGPPYSTATGITIGAHAAYNAASGALAASSTTTPGVPEIQLAPGTYCFSTLQLSGGSSLGITGATVINMTGDFNSSGGSVSNTTSNPNNLQINSSSLGSVQLSGGSGAYMNVYAPTADIAFSGSSTFTGSFIGKTAAASGGATITQGNTGTGGLANWHEVQNCSGC